MVHSLWVSLFELTLAGPCRPDLRVFYNNSQNPGGREETRVRETNNGGKEDVIR